MSLLQFQKALLDLYTEETVLTEFLSRREEALEPYALTVRERRALLSLPSDRLQDFAQGLRAKRMGIARRIFARFHSDKSPAVLFHSHRHGPTLCFNTPSGIRELILTQPVHRLLSRLADRRAGLSLHSLLEAYIHLPEDAAVSPKDAFQAARLIRRNRLVNKRIRPL